MVTRIGISGKGLSVGLLGLMALLSGTGLQVPLLNLCGYFCLITLAMSLLLAFLELRGVELQAVVGPLDEASGKREVWVRAPSRRRAGPFGLGFKIGKRWIPDTLLFAPDPAGHRLTLEVPPDSPLRVRLRAFPMGLVWVGRLVLAQGAGEVVRRGEPVPRLRPAAASYEPFGGIREYRPGEGMRDIHWAASARLGRLVVRIRDSVPELVPEPRPAWSANPDRPLRGLGMMHLATAVTGSSAIAFSWAIGTLTLAQAGVAFAIHGLGAFFSARRQGRPGLGLSVILYLMMLVSLGWFILAARHWQTAAGSTAILLASVAAIFAWDLRNRPYLRAQQLNAFVLMGFTSAIVHTRDTPLMGVLFALTAGSLLLAFWADGRHEMGARTVTWRDLETLPSAWLPIGLMGLLALLAYPWMPALPLPPLPTFGFILPPTQRVLNGNLPGQEGTISLDARWSFSDEPVLRLQGWFPYYLRTEVFQSYGGGNWFRGGHSRSEAWPVPRGATHSVVVALQRSGLTILPLPEGTYRVVGKLPTLMRNQAGVVETHFPTHRGQLYRALYADPAELSTEPPTAAERSTASLEPPLYALARVYSRGETEPERILRKIAVTLRERKRYDLDAPPAPVGKDPTLYFLESAPSGFCVHFATAMVLMARELGIPARLVTGYAPGTWGAGETLVSGKLAHAWVEAWVNGHWVTFDPTPAERGRRPAIHTRLRLVGLGLVGAAIVGYRLWRVRRRNFATERYLALLRRLRRRGLKLEASTSPDEVLAWTEQRVPPAEHQAIREAVRAYEAQRFGSGQG